MLLRRSAAPKELVEQAGRTEESVRSAARYFEEPSDAASSQAAKAADASSAAAKAARAALKGLEHGARREDWLAVSSSLSELSEFAGRAVARAKLLGVEPRRALWPAARDLRAAAAALKTALRGIRAEELVEAKRRASAADTALRRLERESLEDPRVVTGLKDRDVLRCLGEAAHAAQAAAERLAEVLGQDDR